VLLLVVLEAHGLLAAPSRSAFGHRFRLGLSIAPVFRLSECLTRLADVITYYTLC
jgi:hypothetical protein